MPDYDPTKRSIVFRSGEKVSRRLLLKLAAGVAAGATIPSILAACGSDDEEPGGASTTSTGDSGQAAESTPAESGSGESPAGEPKRGGTLRIGYTEPTSLDPQYISGVLEGNIVGLVFDSLMVQDPYSSEYIVGPMSESIEVSDDLLTWTFKIKEGIVFHDGSAFDAHVVRSIYEYAVDPANATWVTGIYLPPEPTFDTPDDFTFTISSPEPYGPMASHLFWDAWFGIHPPEAREKFGEDFGRNPVGAGPFKFKEWLAGDHLTLVRNEDYAWGPGFLENKGVAYLDEIFFKFIAEQSTIVAGLQSGELDMAFLPNQFYDQFAGDSNFEILTRPSGALTALAWNMDRWPFDDPATRKALMHGFDRQRFLQVMENGQGTVMYGSIVPALPHYWAGEQEEGPQYDLEKAKAMLAEAGWEDTDGDGIIERDGKPFQVTLVAGGTEEYVRWSSLAQAQAKDLGIDVTIETLEQAALTAALNSGEYDLFRFGYDTVDPDILAFFFYSPQIPKDGGSGLNRSRVNDPKLDALIDKQRTTLDADRDAAVEEIVRYMMDEAIFLPLYSPAKNTVINKRVKGVIFYPNAMDWELTDAWIDE